MNLLWYGFRGSVTIRYKPAATKHISVYGSLHELFTLRDSEYVGKNTSRSNCEPLRVHRESTPDFLSAGGTPDGNLNYFGSQEHY